MKSEKYAVFLNGIFWDSFQSKANAFGEKKKLRKLFPRESVTVRKVTAP